MNSDIQSGRMTVWTMGPDFAEDEEGNIVKKTGEYFDLHDGKACAKHMRGHARLGIKYTTCGKLVGRRLHANDPRRPCRACLDQVPSLVRARTGPTIEEPEAAPVDMTLRDYFAGKAMEAWLSDVDARWTDEGLKTAAPRWLAAADAMMEARGK